MNSLPRAQETLYFQNAVGKLYYHPLGYVRLAWGPERVPLEMLQAYYEQALTLLLNTRTHKILSEHGQRVPLSAAAQSWITSSWIPRAMARAQVRHCAIVEGADPMHRLSTQSVVAASPAGFIFQRFTTIEDAERWLLSMAD
jgi:hypothetical protein